ncbi:MAG: alpha-galactosidase [Victivallaceae bacterium]|nr:alpha-galactosidase [Victivallaceae bacterium]
MFTKLNIRDCHEPITHVNSEYFSAKLKFLPPEIDNEKIANIHFTKHYRVANAEIGGIPGEIYGSSATTGGIEYRKELFVSHDNRYIFSRVKLTNHREQDIFLNKLYPLALLGKASLIVAEEGLKDWRFVKTCRQKTDVPGAFSFMKKDANFMDAAIEGDKIKAGGGVTGNNEDFLNLETIKAEPFFYIKNINYAGKPGIFFGILGQVEHLTSFLITPDSAMEHDSIICECEFDGVTVSKGESRATHWVMITAVDNETMIREEFSAIFSKEFAIAKPTKHPLTVFCTWQFYGFDFCPADLDENLEALKAKPIPIDVIQLDNGWIDKLGDWNANQRFPEGMELIAAKIKAAGYTPGIWTCPTMIMESSKMAQQHPELIARDKEGNRMKFNYSEGGTYTVDPTVPVFREYIIELYRKLKSWGFTYHKLDFLRSIVLDENIRFHDPKINRAQAFRLACEIIHEAIGDDCYFLACGGINDGASAGLADAFRTGNDMFGFWVPPDGERWKGTLIKIKQTTIRNYTNLFWKTDPDAATIRRRTELFRPGVVRDDLSLGLFTDEEAFTVILNQYLNGGNICVCERFADFDEDRRALYRHMIPSIDTFAKIFDYSCDICPNYFLTEITPVADDFDKWWTLAVGNWHEQQTQKLIDLAKFDFPDYVKEFAVFDFKTQQFLGIKKRDEQFELAIQPHGMELIRLAPWDNSSPVILGTDLHFSGGGVEIKNIDITATAIFGQLETKWNYPVKITAAFPGKKIAIVSATVFPSATMTFFFKNNQ